jgi:hypothetical protein
MLSSRPTSGWRRGLSEAGEEGIWFVNDGPLDYTSVRCRPETPSVDAPVGALYFGGAEFPIETGSTIEAGLGSMVLGDRRCVTYQPLDPVPSDFTLRFRITCTNDRGTWSIHREIDILPPILDTIG